MAVAGGALFSTLTGTSLASTAMLGETLIPEMQNRGYKKSMSIGPILGSGGLALMIPPAPWPFSWALLVRSLLDGFSLP